MAIDVRLEDVPALLQHWQTELQAVQAEALQSMCAVLQSEEKEIVGDDENSPRLIDNIETAVDRDKARVGVASRIVGSGSHDDPELDIGEVAVAREFGSGVQPPRSFLGAAAARRLNDVGSGLAEMWACAFRRGQYEFKGRHQ